MSVVLKIYQEVIEDVINGVREYFLEEQVDEATLQELKQTWESKLRASKAVDGRHSEDKQGLKKAVEVANGTTNYMKVPQQFIKQVVGQVPPNNHVQTQNVNVIETKMVPIQITLPAQPGSDLGQRVLTIQVPASALHGNQLHKVLTGPVLSATMGLPQAIANNLLQQHVNAAFGGATHAVAVGQLVNKPVVQGDGAALPEINEPCCSKSLVNEPFSSQPRRLRAKLLSNGCLQIDGNNDTSDEENEASEEEDGSEDGDEDKEEEDQDLDDGGPEEEPLNSEDDVTDEDPGDLFETDNVVVCQYDKITRSRNKWKFHLKDGIMNLNGEDYVFQKANGDAEW